MEELLDLNNVWSGSVRPIGGELPDIALYMDQIISYLPRQLIHFDDRQSPDLLHGEQLY